MICAWCKSAPAQEGPFCEPACRAQYRRLAEQLGWVRPAVRPKIVSLKVVQTDDEKQDDAEWLADNPMPRYRSECRGAARPCPHVRCENHLYLDVTEVGQIRINFPTMEPWEIPHSCSADLTEQGGLTLEEVGIAINLTRERVRQMLEAIVKKAKRQARQLGIEMEDFRALEAPTHHLMDAE